MGVEILKRIIRSGGIEKTEILAWYVFRTTFCFFKGKIILNAKEWSLKQFLKHL